jgi:hypothetical protein
VAPEGEEKHPLGEASRDTGMWREEGLLSGPAEVQEEGLVRRNTEEGEAVTWSYRWWEKLHATGSGLWEEHERRRQRGERVLPPLTPAPLL